MKRREMFVGAALALAGCASSPPASYYRLAVAPGAIQAIGPVTVGVRGIAIPGYLDQTGIVKPAGGDEFATHANDLWAAPLPDMLQAVMAQDLAQRLPEATVLGSGAIGAPDDLLVEINLLRLDYDTDGELLLVAQISIRSGGNAAVWATRTFQSAAAAGADAAASVPVMSALWGKAADQAAAMLVRAANAAAPSG